MARSLVFFTVVLVTGCMQLNPAFDYDEGFADDATPDGGSDDVAEGESGDAEAGSEQGEGEGSSSGGDGDLPAEACEYEPSFGLDLAFANPLFFGGDCPDSADLWARIPKSGGGPSMVESCTPGCEQCSGALPLAIEPLSLSEHLPDDFQTCVRLQVYDLVDTDEMCEWGAMSVFDGFDDTPYFIGIRGSAEPTPMGLATLAGLIPDPVMVGNCGCDQVGQDDECCHQAATQPEFWGYPWNDDVVMPGESVEIEIPDDADVDHYFEVFQAQRLNGCDDSERSLSWAVFADMP
jgi:hypothetical protein